MPVFLNFIKEHSNYTVEQKSKYKWLATDYGHKIVIEVKVGLRGNLKSVKLYSIEDSFSPEELRELSSIMTVLSVEGGAMNQQKPGQTVYEATRKSLSVVKKQEDFMMKKFIKKNSMILSVALVWGIGLAGLYSLNSYNEAQINTYHDKITQIKREKAKKAQMRQDKANEKAIRYNQKHVWDGLG